MIKVYKENTPFWKLIQFQKFKAEVDNKKENQKNLQM